MPSRPDISSDCSSALLTVREFSRGKSEMALSAGSSLASSLRLALNSELLISDDAKLFESFLAEISCPAIICSLGVALRNGLAKSL